MRKIYILSTLFILLILNSCNKHNNKPYVQKNINRSLPGYYDIDFKKIFSKQDNVLENDSKINNFLNAYYKKYWEDGKLSGGILIAKGKNIIFEKYRGYANISKDEEIGKNTSLHIASVSKVMTSLAVLKLIEAGKLQLNQKVSSVLPSFPYPEMTVKNLLSQRSGLKNYGYLADDKAIWNKGIQMTNQDVLDIYAKYKPDLIFPSGTAFNYCNSNFALLALIIEKITKNPYPEAMKKMIFDPLGMKHTFVFQKKDIGKVALSYFANLKIYPVDHLDLVYGDKNIYSTPRDLFRLSQAMFAKNFLKKELLDQMYTPYSNEKSGIRNYGLGMRMLNFVNGKKIYYHNGWWHGSNAVFVHLVDEKVTIVAIGNKYSKNIYTAFRLAAQFGDYPLKLQNSEGDSEETKVPSLKESSNEKER